MTATILHALLFIQALLFVAASEEAATATAAAPSKADTGVTTATGGPGPAGAAKAGPEQGLLWRVSGSGPAPSYLFGTMHVEDPRVLQLPEVVRDTFADSASLTLEAKLDIASLAAAASRMILDDGRSLRELLHGDLYADVQQLFEARGIPATVMDKFKPWVVSVLLGTPQSKSGIFLDRMLNEEAVRQGKPVHGIETLDEQISLFDDLSLADQIRLVSETVEQHAQLPEVIEQFTRAYLRRDLVALTALAETHMQGHEGLAQTIKQSIIVERNKKMVERIGARLNEGNAFIAVGALHLPGPEGMLQLLKDAGWTIEAIY